MSAKTPVLLCLAAIFFNVTIRADELNMQNGDRYFGRIVSMSENTVVLQSDVLGKVNVPRTKVASISLGANTSAPKPVTNLTRTVSAPTQTSVPATATQTNLDLSAALRGLGANTNFIAQIREQMLNTATPDTRAKYDETVAGLMSGNLNLNDIRRQARSSANQLRTMKKELGPEASDSQL